MLRQLLAIVVLPVTVMVLIPAWIAARNDIVWTTPEDGGAWVAVIVGAVAIVLGLALFIVCVHHFATRGDGTLAPWDPPRRLVVSGPYRYVRNPMITGVVLVLIGQWLALRASPLGMWALVFALLNGIYIPLLEESQLARRFGDEYRTYARNVGRFVPRLTPWSGSKE